MAEIYTPINVQTFVNDTSAVNTVNDNFAAISTAFTDVLSRSGVSPNTMQSTLDMNSNQIINLPPPSTINSPARLIDISGGQITVTTATTGTSGHTVPFLDGANTWSNTQNITTSGTTNSLVIATTGSGTVGNGYSYSSNSVSDNSASSTNAQVDATSVYMGLNGSAVNSARVALQTTLQLLSATNATNPARFYTAGEFVAQALSSDGGGSGTEKGQIFALNPSVQLTGSATHMAGAIGVEIDVGCLTGSSTLIKYGLLISQASTDAVSGSQQDAAICFANQIGAGGWGTLIQIGDGVNANPAKTTGSILSIKGSPTFATGLNLSGATYTGNAIQSTGFAVNNTGTITSGLNGTSGGLIQMNGSTSGNIQLQANSTGNLLTLTQPIQVGVNGSAAGQINIAGLTSGSAQITASATGGTLQLGGNNLTINSSGALSTTSQITISNATAVPAGGSTSVGYLATTTTNLGVFFGSGAPTLTAAQGSIYIRTDGSSTSTRLYVNTTGSNVWTNFTSAA